jgi:hypothetical protein
MIETKKILNYKRLMINRIDIMESGQTLDFADNPERKLIEVAVNDIIDLRIFGDTLTLKDGKLNFKPITQTKGVNVRLHYDRERMRNN